MKLKYLGTAAAEAVPALFCECDVCKKAREMGGRHIRSRSQALIDDTLLIDFPYDTSYHMILNHLSLLDFPYCLITHIHNDHFAPKEMAYIRRGYATVLPENYQGFHVFGSEDLAPELNEIIEKSPDRIFYTRVEPYQPFSVGDYRVTALKANHSTEHPYNYIIERYGKALLYAHDTGHFLPETWTYLESLSLRFSLVSLDCTGGHRTHGYKIPGHHMGLGDNILMREKLTEFGLVNENTRYILNHFSHNGADVDYDTFCPIAANFGFDVSYDGMEVTF